MQAIRAYCTSLPSAKQASDTSSRTATLESRSTEKVALDELSEQQLEELLTQRRLQAEQTLMVSSGNMNAVTAGRKAGESKAVGPQE